MIRGTFPRRIDNGGRTANGFGNTVTRGTVGVGERPISRPVRRTRNVPARPVVPPPPPAQPTPATATGVRGAPMVPPPANPNRPIPPAVGSGIATATAISNPSGTLAAGPLRRTQNNRDMGFLKKIGKGLANIATSLIPGPFDDAIVNTLISGNREQPPQIPQFGSRPSRFGTPRLVRNPARNANQGVPPRAVPTRIFPDIPFVPDLGDVEQFLRGGDPTTSGGAGLLSMLGGNGNGALAQLGIPNKIVMPAQQKVIADAPPGFVIVTAPSGQKFAVEKEFAKRNKLWKPRKKPPISAGDWQKLKTANRVKNKAKKIAETADFTCRTKAQEARRRAKG